MNLLIIGSGAIGRGYLPWVFRDQNPSFFFVDTDQKILSAMKSQGRFSTYMVKGDQYESLAVKVSGAFSPQEFNTEKTNVDYDAVFVSVGPRNVAAIGNLLAGIKAPIILCENDPSTVDRLKAQLGQENIYFAIPDVITSNTAPADLLTQDPLAISTERGVLFIDERVRHLAGDFKKLSYRELIDHQWTAKLYLHNTPHCIAAYIGALVGAQYLHQSMEYPEIDKIVAGSMTEMLNALKARWDIPHNFLDWYAEKELSRFRCKLLFDPIARVAREPLRKLELDGRLIGAAQICLSLGFVPQNVMLGITSALLFDNPKDSDHHLLFMQRSLSPTNFLTHVLGLRQGEALEVALKSHLPGMIARLNKLVGEANHYGG
ncbi:MAG: mannitol-1-phosphate 5-dehydrogenase [Bdellovibrionales bacterium]